MKKLFQAAALSAALFMPFGMTTAVSADPLPEGCTKERGTITCTQSEPVGNAPEHSNAQRTETTTTQKGSFQSSHEPVQKCEGPPGQCK